MRAENLNRASDSRLPWVAPSKPKVTSIWDSVSFVRQSRGENDSEAEPMSTLVCRVEQTHPAAIVTLTGSLDTSTEVSDARTMLRAGLAEMPAVMLIDATDLAVSDCASLGWLKEIIIGAAKWPTVPVYVCGGGPPITRCSLPNYPSVAAAKADWADASPPERVSLALPPDPKSCARARIFVGRACERWGVTRPARIAELLTSELVANAVVHARTSLAVTVRRYGKGIELSVRDDGPGRVPATLPEDPRGFGLQLVDAMSDAWGSAPAGEGKVVWSRLGG